MNQRLLLHAQVFKLLMPHLSEVAAVNTVYRRHVLDATNGLAKSLALGDRDRGLCVKFISERLHGMTVQMLDQRQSFSKLGPYATAIQGIAVLSCLTLYGDIKTAKQRTNIQQYGEAHPLPSSLYQNVTAHPSRASVSTLHYSMWHYNCLCTLKG